MWEWFTSNIGSGSLSPFDVCIALLGLIGGGYVGGWVNAISRMRLEDRRRLLDDLLPAIRYLPLLLPDDATTVHSDGYNSRLSELALKLQAISDTIRLQPWLERSAWREFEGQLPRSEIQACRKVERAIDTYRRDHEFWQDRERATAARLPAMLQLHRGVRTEAEVRDKFASAYNARVMAGRDAHTGAYDALVGHLRLRLRPSRLRWLRMVCQARKRMRWEYRPWAI